MTPSPFLKKRILIVDDQPENIHILIENLESDYEIFFATNGHKALEIALSSHRPDLILLDIMMPGLNGYEVCQQLKDNAATKDVPVIFVTSQTEETDETEGFSMGAVDYITKPFRLTIVRVRIEAALRLKEEMDNRMLLARKLEDLNRNLEQRIEEKTRELQDAHEKLKISELRYRTIFSNAIEGIFQTTAEGKILHVSPSFAQLLGFDSAEELLANLPNAIALYLDPLDREKFVTTLEQYGEISGFETRFIKKDKSTFWTLISAKVIRDPQSGVDHFQGFILDINEKKRAAELELANIHLRELDSLKTALMSTASHDMRSPLTAILGFASLIEVQFSKYFLPTCHDDKNLKTAAETILERLDIIENEGQRLIRMINDFLDISKFESGCTEWNDQQVQLNEISRQAVKVISGQIQANSKVRLETILEPDLPTLSCDPDRLMQVMVNLLGNAAKFTEEGTIHVRTLIAQENQVEVQIKDDGPGIPQKEYTKIFNKFYQIHQNDDLAPNKPKGSGLGLTICKQIVEHYGGRIWVESELGSGSTFIFRLPCWKASNNTP